MQRNHAKNRWGGQDTESEQEFTITGTLSVDVDGALPSEVAKSVYGGSSSLSLENSARTAFPSIPSSITYRVTATSGNKNVQGEVDQSAKSFTIKLSSGDWTVKAEGFSDSDKATKILEGSTPVNLLPNNVDNSISITLYPINSGNGNISLPISVTDDSGIKSAIVKVFEDAKETKQVTVNSVLEYDFSTKKDATISANNLASGTRYFVITFYSATLSEAKANPNQNVAYQVHETVNIFQNLTTNTWSGTAPYLSGTGTNKTFSITKTLTDTFSRKEFFVQGTNGTYTPPTAAASDNNTGTYFDPFATVQKAVDTINDINDGTSAYTIKVDGTLVIESQTDTSAVIIQPKDKNLNLTIEGTSESNKATVRANSNGMRVFIVGNGANTTIKPNVTMKNLIITGGKNESGGGGIRLEAGNLTLSNVDVTGNSTTYGSGGGIYVGGGSCTINGGTISNNKAASNGGGICVESAGSTLKITGTSANPTTLSGNSLTDTAQQETGTAIFVGKGATADLSGNVSITPADTNPTIYLEKGDSNKSDAVLKLGGAVQIGNGSGTGIKMQGKMNINNANIKITSKLTSPTNISLDLFPLDQASNYYATQKPIIEGENYILNSDDCKKFIFDISTQTMNFYLLFNENKGGFMMEIRRMNQANLHCKAGH